MSFKTMDGVEVYDKHEVDTIITPIQQTAADAKQTAESIDSRKFDTSEATREFAADRERLSALEEGKANKSEVNSDFSADRTRITNLENNKVDRSEVSSLVSSTVDGIINAKVAGITSDINHIVDNAIDDELEDYDTPAQTAQKTANAIDAALQSYDNSNTVDQKIATAIDNIPAGPVAMTTAEATAMIDQYF